jgi:hypothetical protein
VRTLLGLGLGLIFGIPATAGDDSDPFAARTGPPRCREHTLERAGVTGTARFATPSISPKEAGGWVGGNRLSHGTPATACAPNPGVFGWDYVGHGWYPGRIFLGYGPDKTRQQNFQAKYNTDPKK